MTRARGAVALSLLLAASGCRRSEAPAPRGARLPPGVVARVGASDVAAATVERIAGAQGVSLARARDRAVSDALLAEQARAELAPSIPSVLTSAALARAVLESIRAEARSQGPPTKDEVDKLTLERWLELDRPRAVVVSHAVAQLAKGRERALTVANAIAVAVAGIRDPEQFVKAARAVPAGDIPVRAERLPALTADGRSFVLEGPNGPQETGRFDATFAKAATALGEPGAQSGLVETRFGFHVILLDAVVPERRSSFEEREQILGEEIVARRGGALRRALIERLSPATPVTIARDVEARTAELFDAAPR